MIIKKVNVKGVGIKVEEIAKIVKTRTYKLSETT